MLNTMRFQSSIKSFLGEAPVDLMNAAMSMYPQSVCPSVHPSKDIAEVK